MAISADHLRQLVIRPACEAIGLYSLAGEELLLGTACQESKCGTFLKQLGDGPALGIFRWSRARMMTYGRTSSATAGSRRQAGSADARWARCCGGGVQPPLCRRDVPQVLPGQGSAARRGRDLQAQATYWKRFYNTPRGASAEAEYLTNWRRFT